MSPGTLGLLYLRPRLLVDRLAIARSPHPTQQDLQVRNDFLTRHFRCKPIGNRRGWEQHGQCGQFLLHVHEDLLHRHRIHGHLHLAGRHIGSYHLQQIVDHQAKGRLKDRRLGRAADQMAQLEDLRDLLEHALNSPPGQVHRKQVTGRILLVVQQVGHQQDLLLAGADQTDVSHIASPLVFHGPDPAPFFRPRCVPERRDSSGPDAGDWDGNGFSTTGGSGSDPLARSTTRAG